MCRKEDVLNKSILELLKIEDEYELRDLITQIPELMIDSQDVNGEYLSLRVRFALVRRESGFISGLVAVLHDTTRAGEGRTRAKTLSFQT